MQLRSLSIENLNIPFKLSFQHSAATRTTTEAVLITAVTENDVHGIGEGCPRSYVTGETLESAHGFFTIHRSDFLNIHTLVELEAWVKRHQPDIDKNPAAFCAVELALLDALAQETNQTIEALLSLPELSGTFYYTGVLGSRNPKNFQTMLQRYLQLGFTDFKIKVFGETKIDQANITAIKECDQDNLRVRLDANNLWSDVNKAIRYINDLDYPIFALEEPLGIHKYNDCKKIFKALGTPIILDESFMTLSDFEHIQDNQESWIINIRISKMGGILRSLSIADKAKQTGIPIIIGSQVGETSILTRAALTVANHYRNILLAQEGAYGTYLLEHDIVDPPIMFKERGILKVDQI